MAPKTNGTQGRIYKTAYTTQRTKTKTPPPAAEASGTLPVSPWT
jgi:hypothetical protein